MKLFRNEDCTYTALYGRYLHYQKAPGQWDEVDLNFRLEGASWVMDRHDIEVRITGAVLKATERETGKGIRWVMPMPPVVSGRSARFSSGGLQWEYSTNKSGLKLSAMVAESLGQRTWEFPYQMVGGAAGLSLDEEGNLVSDVFTVPRPFALGADGNIYEVSEWRLLPGSRIAFDFDDSQLPPEAFPYELDPTTTFSVAAGTDDGHVSKTGILYPPPGSATASTGGSTITTRRSVIDTCPADGLNPSRRETWGDMVMSEPPPLCPQYDIQNALMRWDTSALPDNAVVTGATLRAYVSARYYGEANRGLTADWFTAWPIDAADYSETAQTSAINGFPIIDIEVGADNDIPLTAPGIYVSKTGYTGLRLHVSGGQPNGRNQVDIKSYESTVSPEPRLLVTYSTPPSISSASDSPDPVTAGDAMTFSASWTDADPGDSVRTVVCRTNQISSGFCPGGTWTVGNLSGSSPSTAGFFPTAWDHGNQTYYAFVCDAAGSCSSSVSGTFTVQNRTPSIISVSDAPDPIEAGNQMTFTSWWSDPGDSVRAVICKTNAVSAGTCPGGAWAIGIPSYGNPSTVSFTPWDIDAGVQTYFAFACDAASACSSSSSGTFEVQPSMLLFDDLLAVVGERNPDFGGAYMDEGTGELFVYLTSPTQQAAAAVQEDLVEVLGDASLATSTAVAVPAEYDFMQLREWYEQMRDDVWAVPGVVQTDIDDRRNRIGIGVQNLTVQGPLVEAALSNAGVPAQAVIIEEMDAEVPASSLSARHRPVVGGLKIFATVNSNSESACTLGVNAIRTNQQGNQHAGFITNSHCSAVLWTQDESIFWQPDYASSVQSGNNKLGEETVDPPGFVRTQNSACPWAHYCRYSDATFVRYNDGVNFSLGRIARPATENSTNWNGTSTYRITGELPRHDLVGKTVSKVGYITGQSTAAIESVCANTYNSVDHVIVLCQSRAPLNTGYGDSGAPVFKYPRGDDVLFAGLLWSKAGSFSSITNIQLDLGNLRTKA